MLLYSNKLHIGITISRSFALSINALLIFDMRDINEALFLKVGFLFLLLLELVPVTLIIPFTTVYASLYSHKSDLKIEVLNLIFLLTEYWPLDKSFNLIDLFVTNFGTIESFSSLDILYVPFLKYFYLIFLLFFLLE